MLVLRLPQVRVGEPHGGILDALDLAIHDGEDLDRDAIELVVAAPGSDLGETYSMTIEQKRRRREVRCVSTRAGHGIDLSRRSSDKSMRLCYLEGIEASPYIHDDDITILLLPSPPPKIR